MPSARAPSMSSAYESPTITVSAAPTRSAASARLEDRGMRLRPAVTLRADRDVDVELVMPRERLEVALPVRDQADPEPVGRSASSTGSRRRRGRSWRGSPSGGRSRRRRRGRRRCVAAHAADDVLGECDPDLLVVLELGVLLQVGERRDPARPRSAPGRGEPMRAPPPAGTPRARAPARAGRA